MHSFQISTKMVEDRRKVKGKAALLHEQSYGCLQIPQNGDHGNQPNIYVGIAIVVTTLLHQVVYKLFISSKYLCFQVESTSFGW